MLYIVSNFLKGESKWLWHPQQIDVGVPPPLPWYLCVVRGLGLQGSLSPGQDLNPEALLRKPPRRSDMKYRVTLQKGEVHEFDSPFHPESLRKSMGLPLTAKIEVIQPKESIDADVQSDQPQ